jgi:hypothetical protein
MLEAIWTGNAAVGRGKVSAGRDLLVQDRPCIVLASLTQTAVVSFKKRIP